MTDLSPDQLPDGWSDGATSYAVNFGVLTRSFCGDAVRLASVTSGSDVLDVAAGTGEVTAAASGAGATVMSTDFAPGMVSVLEERFADDARVTVRQMDGQALDLPDNSFDATISMFGLMFFPDADRGLAEMHRVLRPGGHVAIGVWTETFGLSTHVAHGIAAALPSAPPSRPPVWAPFAHRMPSAIAAAEFRDVEVHTVTHEWHFDDPVAFFHSMSVWSPPMAMMLQRVPTEQFDAVARGFAESIGASGNVTALAEIAVAVR